EIGGKNTLLEHTLQVNWSVFWINWKNIQQNVYLPTCGEQFTANLGQVRSRGDDDILFRPVETVMLELTVAYTDAKFTRSSCAGALSFDAASGLCSGIIGGEASTAPPIVSEGNRLAGAPWTIIAAVEKTFVDWKG